jgi:MFS family permease
MKPQIFSKVKIPRSVWALGLVSLFMDTSSELIHSLLPIFMVSTLGSSMTLVGITEGIAEATALITKIFSGAISDYFRKRKLLTMIGYGMAALTKPLFPLANTISLVLTARFIDRIGKGIRGAPRDAMVSDIAPPEIRGACFGLRQSLDTVGAFVGPLLAIAGMILLANNLRFVLWIATVPAFIALAVLAFGVKEPKAHHHEAAKDKIKFSDIRNIGGAYWQLIIIASIFTFAKFSDAFLILKANDIGLPITFVPLIIVLMNVIYALVAYPAGLLSDKINKKTVLLIGIIFLIISDLVMAFSGSVLVLMIGVTFWGLHMAFTQGTFAAMVADAAPARLRGTAYGVFNFICGIAMLFSSVIAGMLWDNFGPAYTFLAGAGFTVLSFIGLLVVRKWSPS